MHTINGRLRQDTLAGGLMDALPCAVVLLNRALEIEALNGPALAWIGTEETRVLGRRPGDALGCVSAIAAEEGCGGGPLCGKCLLRHSALEVLGGTGVSQREVRVTTGRDGGDGGEQEHLVLLSGSPFSTGDREYALEVLQDVTLLHRLRGLLPICASCKKIRREDQAWEVLEAFIEGHSHAEFTHSICPNCLERLYPEYEPGKGR
jgi:PAS domain-containing protein